MQKPLTPGAKEDANKGGAPSSCSHCAQALNVHHSETLTFYRLHLAFKRYFASFLRRISTLGGSDPMPVSSGRLETGSLAQHTRWRSTCRI